MPTSRKPIDAISRRLAAFSTKMRDTSFQIPAGAAAVDQGVHGDAAGALAALRARDVDRKLGDAGITVAAAVAGGRRKRDDPRPSSSTTTMG